MTTDIEGTGALARMRNVIDFVEIGHSIWRRKWILFGGIALCFLACVAYLHVARPVYSVTIQVTAVDDQGKAARGGLSDLASVAGISLPTGLGNRQDSFELFLQNVYSRETAADLAKDQALMQELYPTQWDAENNQWKPPGSMTRVVTRPIKYLLGIPSAEWHPPDGVTVQDFIVKNVRVSRDIKNPIVTLQLDHYNPDFAMRFLTKLQQVDDLRLRLRALSRTSKYIEYLNGELGKVVNEDYRKALIDLLSDQEKSRMFASSTSNAFAAEPFGAATSSALPTSPNAPFLLFLSLMMGVLLGGFAAYFRDTMR